MYTDVVVFLFSTTRANARASAERKKEKERTSVYIIGKKEVYLGPVYMEWGTPV